MDSHSFYLLNSDPDSEKLLDQDPQKMNADTQPRPTVLLTIAEYSRFIYSTAL